MSTEKLNANHIEAGHHHDDPKKLEQDINNILQHANEVDDPAKLVAEIAPTLTPAEHRKLLLKLDCTVLPICWLLYFINCLDRASIGNAAAYGFRRDVGAAGNTFNIGVSIFYLAYVVMEIPSNLAMKKIGAHIWLPAAGILYGVVTLSTSFVDNRGSFLAVRFLLGIFEGATLPGCSYYLSLWYSRQEFTSRFAIFISASPLSSAISSLLSTAYFNIGTITSTIFGWRNIFFINAILSFFIAIVAFLALPKNPIGARFLSNHEKTFLMGQSSALTAGRAKEEGTKAKLIKRAFTNPSTWFGVLPWFCAQILAGSIGYFLPEILTGFGWSGTKANLQVSAIYFTAMVWVLLLGFLAHLTKHHAIWIIINCLTGIIGFCIFCYPDAPNTRYGGSFLCAMSLYGAASLTTSWTSANSQPYTTRSVALAISISLGACGGIVGSWVFISSEAAQRYPTGQGLIFAFNGLTTITTAIHYLYCRWENKQRELGKRNWRLDDTPENVALLGNLHPSFRYAT